MKILRLSRNAIVGIIAYIISSIHDFYCKHYGKGWVYIPWKMTLKEHVDNVKDYYETRVR